VKQGDFAHGGSSDTCITVPTAPSFLTLLLHFLADKCPVSKAETVVQSPPRWSDTGSNGWQVEPEKDQGGQDRDGHPFQPRHGVLSVKSGNRRAETGGDNGSCGQHLVVGRVRCPGSTVSGSNGQESTVETAGMVDPGGLDRSA
jgi:hypothetical protein